MNEKKIAMANWMAETYYGLVSNKEYVLEKNCYGTWSVYDFEGNYITECRADCFDNYRDCEFLRKGENLKNNRNKLIQILNSYFDIGDSYVYHLTRDKSAFAVGTVSVDDFEEFDDDTIADIADYIIKHWSNTNA